MTAEITFATAQQTAIPELKREAKQMHYIIIKTPKGEVVINSGENTINKLKAISDEKGGNTPKTK